MTATDDFECAWLAKLSQALDEVAGPEIRRTVMQGSETLSSQSSPPERIDWSRQAMERLQSLVDTEGCRAVMTSCACQYPPAELRTLREAYAQTGDIDLVHRMLQEKFESFLRDHLGLSDAQVETVVAGGWGLAGIKRGNTIEAIKIPKSGNLIAYLEETDRERRRQDYCHCPRIRAVLATSETIPAIYCYCGAGFYQGIWEEILQRPVRVEVLETVMDGGEVCRIAIHLEDA